MTSALRNSADQTPMHVVVAVPYALWQWHVGTDLDIIEKHLDCGDEVTVLACQGQFEACDMNEHHEKSACKKCRGTRMAALEMLSRPVHVESIDQLSREDLQQLKRVKTRFDSIEQLKAYKTDGFDIGMAALSSLVSFTRDPEVDLQEHHELLARLLRAAWISFRSMRNYVATVRVDRVYTFNGRFAPVRGVLRACQQAGVECVLHDRGHDGRHYALYPNAMPHDQNLFHQRALDAWNAAESDDLREEIATEWFHQRAAGVAQNWVSFVAEQDKELLPDDWDPNRRNIVFFSTSEDEFVAISDRWSNPIYPSQLDALRTILPSLESDPRNAHLYVRMHPNLANVDNRQRRETEALRSPHLTVIKPTEPISTYALMRKADKVLTVGSTAGIEAVFWGTPSVLIGPSFYQEFGATYNPTSHEELMRLLYADLEPKDRTPTLIYGYHMATFGTAFEHFEPDDLLLGRFKGVPLSKLRKSKWQIWLHDRRRFWRPKLSPLALELPPESAAPIRPKKAA